MLLFLQFIITHYFCKRWCITHPLLANFCCTLDHGSACVYSAGAQSFWKHGCGNTNPSLRRRLHIKNGQFERRRNRGFQRGWGRFAMLPASLRIFSERSCIRDAYRVHKAKTYEYPGTKLQRWTSPNDA